MKILIAAIGDTSFHRITQGGLLGGNLIELVKTSKSCDIVIGNLEGPLSMSGMAVSGKCAIGGSPGGAEVLRNGGIGAVCLANNHMMDFGQDGLVKTLEELDRAGVRRFGAGRNIGEALSPFYVEKDGIRLALLGRSAVVVSSPCYANGETPGVAHFNLEETKQAIKASRKEADIVAVAVHWGVEHYSYPTPEQRKQAKELIDAGADLILGHHPHVLQGIERIGDGLVCYSLGNFLFDDIMWSFVDKEGKPQVRIVRLSEENRKGGIVKVSLAESNVESYEFIPTRIDQDGTVRIEATEERQQEFKKLCSRLQWPAYSLFWRLYSLRMEWKLRLKPMTIGRVKWANLKKIRPKHLKELYDGIRRSGKIAAEKSTNPYE